MSLAQRRPMRNFYFYLAFLFLIYLQYVIGERSGDDLHSVPEHNITHFSTTH